jgi:O-antigen ligase
VDKYLKIIPKAFFIGGLLIIPFFYLPNSPIPFEIPKVWLFNRWVEVITISGLIFSTSEIKKNKFDMVLVVLLTLFLSTILITSLAGVDIQKSLLGNYYRGDGLFTLFHLASLFFFIILFFQTKWLKPTIISISISAIGISLWILTDAFRFYVLNNPAIYNWGGALTVSFGNPNFLSGYLLITLPFTAYLSHVVKKKYYYLGLFIQISAILLTFARAGVIGILIFFSLWYLISKKTKPLIIIFLVLVVLLITTCIVRNDKLYESGILVSESRHRIYTKAVLAFRAKPFTGWGWANFDYAFDSTDWPLKVENDVYVDKAHSAVLEILVTTGLFGLILYIAYVIRSAKILASSNNFVSRYLLMSLALYLFHSQINVVSISEEAIFWIITGVSAKRSLFR